MLGIGNHALYFILGPVIYRDDDTDINSVVGIVSFGFGCATPSTPGYYSNVHPQRKWINKVIKDGKTDKCPNDKKRQQNNAACTTNSLYNHPTSSANKMLLLLLLLHITFYYDD